MDLVSNTGWRVAGRGAPLPTFTPKAAWGIDAILFTPVVAVGRPVGALNISILTVKGFIANEQELASTFAFQTSTVVTDAGVAVTDQEVGELDEATLRTREFIAEAQGAVMDREVLTADEAHALLRRISVKRDQTLAELAAEVVAATQHPHPRGEQRDPNA